MGKFTVFTGESYKIDAKTEQEAEDKFFAWFNGEQCPCGKDGDTCACVEDAETLTVVL
jgi:hypothetical protein